MSLSKNSFRVSAALSVLLLATGCASTSGGSTSTAPAAGATAAVSATPVTATVPPADPSASVKVWANPKTKVYHCLGTGAFGLHPDGKQLTQADAKKDGYRPAFGRPCPAVPVAAEMAYKPSSKTRAGGKGCGVERWPVKTLVDDDKGSINRTPVEAAITDLVSIPRPDQQPPQANRISPTEETVFHVRALLTLVKKEKDQDYHLVLADPDDPETTMIAEVPSPTCATGSNEDQTFKALRKALDPYLGQHEEGVPVEIEGVGFFDFLHNQTGVAPNGIELHPVLSLTFSGQ